MKLLKSLIAALALTAGAAHAAIVPVGIQTNVSVAQVQSWGWTSCYQDNGYTYTSLTTIRNNCSGSYIMLADKNYGSDTFSVLAAASNADVFTNTGDYNNVTHTANGVDWYFSENWSMGYTKMGNSVYRTSCDINLYYNNSLGSCWHTGNNALNGGWALNDGSFRGTNERWILMSNGPSQVPEPGSFALLGLGLLGLAAARKSIKANKA